MLGALKDFRKARISWDVRETRREMIIVATSNSLIIYRRDNITIFEGALSPPIGKFEKSAVLTWEDASRGLGIMLLTDGVRFCASLAQVGDAPSFVSFGVTPASATYNAVSKYREYHLDIAND